MTQVLGGVVVTWTRKVLSAPNRVLPPRGATEVWRIPCFSGQSVHGNVGPWTSCVTPASCVSSGWWSLHDHFPRRSFLVPIALVAARNRGGASHLHPRHRAGGATTGFFRRRVLGLFPDPFAAKIQLRGTVIGPWAWGSISLGRVIPLARRLEGRRRSSLGGGRCCTSHCVASWAGGLEFPLTEIPATGARKGSISVLDSVLHKASIRARAHFTGSVLQGEVH